MKTSKKASSTKTPSSTRSDCAKGMISLIWVAVAACDSFDGALPLLPHDMKPVLDFGRGTSLSIANNLVE